MKNLWKMLLVTLVSLVVAVGLSVQTHPRGELVARAGFEPAISSLRGRHPRPLDERAILVHRVGFEPTTFCV
jgi:hypothetical protein